MTGNFFRKFDIWKPITSTVIFMKILRNQFSCPYKIMGKITVTFFETDKTKCSQLPSSKNYPNSICP